MCSVAFRNTLIALKSYFQVRYGLNRSTPEECLIFEGIRSSKTLDHSGDRGAKDWYTHEAIIRQYSHRRNESCVGDSVLSGWVIRPTETSPICANISRLQGFRSISSERVLSPISFPLSFSILWYIQQVIYDLSFAATSYVTIVREKLSFLMNRDYLCGSLYALISVFGVCLVRMHAHSTGICSWVRHDHHHHEIMISISPAEAHKPYSGGDPYTQHRTMSDDEWYDV